MKPKTASLTLACIAGSLTVALFLVLLYRPGRADSAPTGPAPAAGINSQASPLPRSAAVPQPRQTATAGQDGPHRPASAEIDARSAGANPAAYSQTDEARRSWEPVVVGFGRAFTATGDRDAATWRSRLAPYVTAKVCRQLATICDLRYVPAGRFAGIEALEYGDDNVAVLIDYDVGPTLVAYVLFNGTDWQIYAYDWCED